MNNFFDSKVFISVACLACAMTIITMSMIDKNKNERKPVVPMTATEAKALADTVNKENIIKEYENILWRIQYSAEDGELQTTATACEENRQKLIEMGYTVTDYVPDKESGTWSNGNVTISWSEKEVLTTE